MRKPKYVAKAAEIICGGVTAVGASSPMIYGAYKVAKSCLEIEPKIPVKILNDAVAIVTCGGAGAIAGLPFVILTAIPSLAAGMILGAIGAEVVAIGEEIYEKLIRLCGKEKAPDPKDYWWKEDYRYFENPHEVEAHYKRDCADYEKRKLERELKEKNVDKKRELCTGKNGMKQNDEKEAAQ